LNCEGFRPRQAITTKGIKETDFTVLVRMGNNREGDRFYVVPTIVVWKEIGKRQAEQKPRGRKEIGMWRLSFNERRDGRVKAGHGIERRWSQYLDRWELLDG
jgi:hypothetical protein